APQREVHDAERDAPDAQRKQAVGVRVADEIQWSHLRRTGLYFHALDTEQHQRRPQQVGELAREKQGAERHGGRRLLRPEPDTEMPDEHRSTSVRMISSFAMPLIGAEAVAASALALLSSAIITAYLADWVGFAIRPFVILALSAAAAAGTFFRLWPQSASDRPAFIAFGASVFSLFAWLLWLARPDFLPTGS